MKLVKSFLFILFLFLPTYIFADVLNGLSVQISSNGDVPTISIFCVIGNNYTFSLVSDSLSHNYGAVERKYCATGIVTFSAFNINTLLTTQIGSDWPRWVRVPFSYVIKDTTGPYLSSCNESSCPLNNLSGAFNSYDNSVYLASNTYWSTVGAGPIFSTEDYSTWFNIADGDGSANYVEPPTYSSVLFLPGIKASRLYKEGIINCSVNCEDQLWEPNWDTDVEALFMNPDGTSVDSSIYTRGVMDEAYGSINIYKSFLENLEEMKVVDGTIADYSAVPYDWRLSLEDIINGGVKIGENISYIGVSNDPYIESELRRLASTSDNGKVTIVAHSNGGLVAKALLKKLADENDPLLAKVDKVIFVAVPHLGTPSAITAMLHGDKQGIPIVATERTARRLGENLKSGYNLFPSEKYFETIDNPVVTFGEGLEDWEERFGAEVDSEESFHNFLTDSYERVESSDENLKTPSYLRDELMDDAESVHEYLDSWIPPSTMEIIEIAGWGIPTTISGVEYYEDKGVVKFRPITTIDGDGTVVTPSAHWSNGVTASTTKYWVDEGQWNRLANRIINLQPLLITHKDIFEIPEVISLIEDSIENSTTTPIRTYVFTEIPNRVVNESRLVYSLHSPLTLDIYDSLGNHTGVSTTTGEIEEQIPGTYFIQFGDEKYIFTDTGTPFTISMSGYDSGTFTFKIQQLQGDNTISTVEFKDVPTTSNTKVSMSITDDIQTLSSLFIDSNSDGSSDIALVPVINGIVTYTPPAPSVSQPVAPSGNGPPVMQSVTQLASTTTDYILIASTTPIQIEISTTTLTTTTPPVLIEINQKSKQVTQKAKVVSQQSIEQTIVPKNVNQTAQVIVSTQKLPSKFKNFISRFSNWLTDVFK